MPPQVYFREDVAKDVCKELRAVVTAHCGAVVGSREFATHEIVPDAQAPPRLRIRSPAARWMRLLRQLTAKQRLSIGDAPRRSGRIGLCPAVSCDSEQMLQSVLLRGKTRPRRGWTPLRRARTGRLPPCAARRPHSLGGPASFAPPNEKRVAGWVGVGLGGGGAARISPLSLRSGPRGFQALETQLRVGPWV